MKEHVKASAGRTGGMKRVAKGFAKMDSERRKAASAKGNAVRWKTGTPISKYDLYLNLSMRKLNLMSSGWEGDYNVPIDAEIWHNPESGPERKIGEARAFWIMVGQAANHRMPLEAAIDYCSATAPLLELFSDVNDHRYKDEVEKKFDLTSGSDLLWIDHIEIEPTFRGCGVGLAVVRMLEEYAANSSALVVMCPPRGLRKYFAKAGFQAVPKTASHLCALDTARRQPDISPYLSLAEMDERKGEALIQ